NTERFGRRRLRPAAFLVKLDDPDHQVGAELEVLRLSLVETEVGEDVAAAAHILQLFGHCRLLSSTSDLNLRRAKSTSVRAVLRDFFSNAGSTYTASMNLAT